MNGFARALKRIEDAVFRYPGVGLGVIAAVTVLFAAQIPGLRMYSNFADLLPQEHPYIQLHNDIRDTFGGANIIFIAVEVDEGTIFTNDALGVVHRLTRAVDLIEGVDHNQLASLTHLNSRHTWLSEAGDVVSDPFYSPPRSGVLTAEQLAHLRANVLADPRAYGLLVSEDLKAALIKATLHEGELDYEAIFDQLQTLRANESLDGITIHLSGLPVLVGWAYTYVAQIVQIFLLTLVILFGLLVAYFRRLYGVVIPLAGVAISAIWGIGIMVSLGFNLDPLILVIPFLISARAMSHGIQLVERYYGELAIVGDGKLAARRTFDSLFRPGSLGVVSDAVGLLLIALGSVPINTKLSFYASLWALCVILNVLLTIPLLLSVLPKPRNAGVRHGLLRQGLGALGHLVARKGTAKVILVGVIFCYLIGSYGSSFVQIGDSQPGSPLLYPDHEFNVSARAISSRFPGSEELYIIARADKKGGLKRPEVLAALADFQNHMALDPGLGAMKGLPDLVRQVNRLLHNDDLRWYRMPNDNLTVGGLMFAYMASSPVPGALKEFVNPQATDANMVFYYKDRRGPTVRRAIYMAKSWIEENGDAVEGLSFHLAGGTVGVTAAINEAVFDTNRLVIPLVLVFIFLFVTLFYRSFHAGWLMFLAMSFATVLSYAYMGARGIGLNINTVLMIAVGIGVGIDYSIYIMDRIREEMTHVDDLSQAIARAIGTTGLAVCVTAGALVLGVILWVFMSDLKFQAEAAMMLIVMLGLNFVAALFIVPAWITLFRPKFILHGEKGL